MNRNSHTNWINEWGLANWKLAWYAEDGFELGKNLFTSEERKGEGLKMDVRRGIAAKIKDLVS